MFSARRKPCCSPSNGKVGHGDALLLERVDDHLGLVRRDDFVLEALEDDHRRLEAVEMVDWRALVVDIASAPGKGRSVRRGSVIRTCACP